MKQMKTSGIENWAVFLSIFNCNESKGLGTDETDRPNLYIIGRFCLSVTFLLIYGSRSVFMGIHGSRLVIHSSRLVLMVFIGSRLVFHVSRLVVHGFS